MVSARLIRDLCELESALVGSILNIGNGSRIRTQPLVRRY